MAAATRATPARTTAATTRYSRIVDHPSPPRRGPAAPTPSPPHILAPSGEGWAQRVARLPLRTRPGREHLVQLDGVALEVVARPGQVETPDPGRGQARLGDALLPVAREVVAPG